MKLTSLMLPIVFGITLTACQNLNQNPMKPTLPVPVNVQPLVIINKTPTINELQSYSWHLLNAKDKQGNTISGLDLTTYGLRNTNNVISLNFSVGRDNKVGISYDVGCNKMVKAVTYENGLMTAVNGTSISTLMGCGKLYEAERLLNAQMVRSSKLSISVEGDNKATLTQITSDNNTLLWQGTLKPEVKYGKGETLYLQVAPQDERCEHLTQKHCLMAREVSYNDQGIKTYVGDWHLWYEPIEGYQKSPNQGNILRLKRYRTQPTDTKGYDNLYVLDSIIETTELSQ